MATGPGVNQGKTAFLEEFLPGNRDASLEVVNRAWSAAGNEGTISESLFGKIRARLGLTGKRTAPESGEVPTRKPRAKSQTGGGKSGRTTGSLEQGQPAALKTLSHRANGADASTGEISATRQGDEEDVLDELEEGIDELIQRIRELGGKSDVVKALKRARRLLVRSHEG